MVNAVDIYAHTGLDVQSVMCSNTCSFTMVIDVVGLGISQPYDAKRYVVHHSHNDA